MIYTAVVLLLFFGSIAFPRILGGFIIGFIVAMSLVDHLNLRQDAWCQGKYGEQATYNSAVKGCDRNLKELK